MSISISPTSSWKNVSNKCCWKVLGGITILRGHTSTNLTNILNETCGSNTCSTCLIAYSTRFKHVDVIKLTCWCDQIDVGTTMVPIENNPSSMATIKSSYSLDIPKWKL
jgi:hypothetical protein